MTQLVPEQIAAAIHYFKGHKIILDFHLAKLYEVETRSLKQQVKRNLVSIRQNDSSEPS